MNLWDVFGVAAVLSIRDYYRDLDYQKHKTAKFYQKCIEEISNDMSAAFELICGEFERVSPDNIPTEIVNGSDLAPKNWTSYNVRKKKKRLTKELKEDGKKELHSRADHRQAAGSRTALQPGQNDCRGL